MDSQELNRACELAFLVAREGVEQDPPIDPPAPMRMFLYVRQYPQRALTVARQVLTDNHEFRARVATAATEDNVGSIALEWLNGNGEIPAEGEADEPQHDEPQRDEPAHEASKSDVALDEPVSKESIRNEMDELKSLVGQLSDERAAVGSEVQGLAGRLEEAEEEAGLSSALAAASAGSDSAAIGSASLTAQIRSLHTDLKQARLDRDHAQESKELAILEHAELAEELENLRNLAGTARVQLTELESKVDAVSTEKDQLASEKQQLSDEREQLAAERDALTSDKDSLSADVQAAEAKLAESEERLAEATANLDRLTADLDAARSNAGASVEELQSAVAARAAMESHVDALGGAHAKARAEMERVNAALADKDASDSQKIETLKVALVSVTAERDALQAKLAAVRATVDSLQGEMAKLDSNFSDAESVASVLSERMEELQSSVDSMPGDEQIQGDLSEFDTPDMPEIEDFAPANLGSFEAPVVAVEAEQALDTDADDAGDVSDVIESFTDDEFDDDEYEFGYDADDADDAVEAVAVVADIEADDAPTGETDEQSDDEEDEQDEGAGGLAGSFAAATAAAVARATHDDSGDDAPHEVDTDEVAIEQADEVSFDDFAESVDAIEADNVDAQYLADEVVEEPADVSEAVLDEHLVESEGGDDVPLFDAAEIDSGSELIPEEILPASDIVDEGDYHDPEFGAPAEIAGDAQSVSPLVMSDTAEEFDEVPVVTVDEVIESPDVEDIDEVHALVAETVASFEPTEADDLPGSAVPAEEAAEAGASANKGGLTSLFTSFVAGKGSGAEAGAETDDEPGGGVSSGLLATAGVGVAAAAGTAAGVGSGAETIEHAVEETIAPAEAEAPVAEQTTVRGPIEVPGDVSEPLDIARHVVNTENAVLLVDGDPVAAMGWPSVDRVEQRRNLVHYLSVMAGTSGAAPDVLLDRDFGVDRLPDSRSVRVRVTNEEGSVSAQIVSLIDSYPTEWPVVVVTDNMDLAAEAAMKGATLLDNGQLLDLFIAP